MFGIEFRGFQEALGGCLRGVEVEQTIYASDPRRHRE